MNSSRAPRKVSVKPRRFSAGIVLFRRREGGVQVLLGHMGGPLWQRRDVGAWSIPKGGYGADEDPFVAARREYAEEVGVPLPDDATYLPLGDAVQANNKKVTAWAVEGDLDPADAVSNTFQVEWPPRSGRMQSFPEFDRVAWFDLDDARARIVVAQGAFLDRLREALEPGTPG
ncbi:MAG: NUDIX domain-containing protein [Kineosporiaceae bacterium]|nr:NUDIX domain-containing protein [Kineosporiaceae bacterium]